MPAPIALRLATRQWAARPLRPILCSIAISAAVALILCVGVAMDSLRHTVMTAIGQHLGVAEVHVRPGQRDTDVRMPESLLQKLRERPEVELAGGRLYTKGVLVKGDERRWFDTLGIDPETDERLRPKNYSAGRTILPGPRADQELVVDADVAKVLNLKVGDQLRYSSGDGPTRPVTLVGITNRPSIQLISPPTIFISLDGMARDMGIERAYKVFDLKLKERAGITDFDAYARALGKELGPAYEVVPGTTSKAKLTEITRTMQILLLLLSVMAAICAALIIGTTLSVGVQERIRQFGQLRCIGASRGQLALFLLADAFVMLVIGEVFGTLLGLVLSASLVAYFPDFFAAFEITPISLMVSLLCGGLATMFGAAIPIWQVTRVPPMAAVTAVGKASGHGKLWRAGVAGIACLGLQVLLWNVLPGRELRFYSYVMLGLPLVFAGWCLLAPAVLVAGERAGALVLGTLFRVRPALLRSAWSSTPWRAGAMIAALMIGATLLTTVRARGASLLASWSAPAHIPDLIVKSIGGGLSEKRLERLHREHPELRDITLLDYFSVRMGDKVFQLGKLFGEGETTFIAVDPATFPERVELEYLEGDPVEAAKKLALGRHVFVSKEFKNVRKLGVGDKIRLRAADGQMVDFTIAAVVTSTGVELVKNYFDLRQSFGEKAVSSVMGSLADGKQFFKLGEPTIMLANVDRTLSPESEADKLQEKLAFEGLQSISSVGMKRMLRHLIEKLMDGLSVIGFGAMCVASLGVANMVIASIHARRYEFGVLRAIGAGRWQLVRLVLAEVTLISLVAGVLGTASGLHFAYMASLVDFLLIGFPTQFLATSAWGAMVTGLGLLGVAIVLTTLLGWLAALAPAVRGARTAQRTLLASGRA